MRSMACLVLLASAVLALAARAETPAAGMLLVATSTLEDPNFAESVLLIIYHDDNGSLGIFVNRPTNLRPSRVFPDLEALADYADSVFLGGPVDPRQALMLLRDPPPGAVPGEPVVPGVYITADASVLERYESRLDDEHVRLYAGHAAWGPGQLQAEIDDGDWTVMPGRADLVFTAEPLELWRATARHGSGLVAGRGRF
jgi:putative transcriptional regulator